MHDAQIATKSRLVLHYIINQNRNSFKKKTLAKRIFFGAQQRENKIWNFIRAHFSRANLRGKNRAFRASVFTSFLRYASERLAAALQSLAHTKQAFSQKNSL